MLIYFSLKYLDRTEMQKGLKSKSVLLESLFQFVLVGQLCYWVGVMHLESCDFALDEKGAKKRFQVKENITIYY